MRKFPLLTGALLAALALTACQKPPATADTTAASDVQPSVGDAANPSGATAAGPAGTAGVARAPDPGVPPLVTARYDCDGSPTTVEFDNTAHTVRVQAGDKTVGLPSAMSGSGARYADDKGNEFWEHQGEAMLTLAGGKQQTCKKVEAAAG